MTKIVVMKKNAKVASVKTQTKARKLILKINPQVYPLEVVQGAAYTFIDRAYVDITGNPKKEIEVLISVKEDLGPRELKRLKGEFQNELLNYALRRTILQNNKKIREYIISRALFSAVVPAEEEFNLVKKEAQKAKKKERASRIKEGDFIDDPLGIAVPWEEKYGGNRK